MRASGLAESISRLKGYSEFPITTGSAALGAARVAADALHHGLRRLPPLVGRQGPQGVAPLLLLRLGKASRRGAQQMAEPPVELPRRPVVRGRQIERQEVVRRQGLPHSAQRGALAHPGVPVRTANPRSAITAAKRATHSGSAGVWWVEFKGEGRLLAQSAHEIDRIHMAFWDEYLEPDSRTVFQTELVLLPAFIQTAIDSQPGA